MTENSDSSSTLPTPPTQEADAAETPAADSSGSLANVETKLKPKARREQVWQLRVVERRSWQFIGQELGINATTARKDFLALRADKFPPDIQDQVRREQNAIYEAMLDKWLPVAIDETDAVPRLDGLGATDRVVKILAEQAKLHGVGQPGKSGPSAAELGREFGDKVVDAMYKLAMGRQGKEAVVEAEIVTPELKDATEKNT